MLASEIVSRAQTVLNDANGARWPEAELLKWISDGQRVIVLVRPDSYSINESLTLVAGTKQTLPSGGLRLLDVIRNLKSNGDPDRSVRMVDRETLDAQDYNWHVTASTGKVMNFVYDNRDPIHFYVYPQATAGMKLEILYSKSPVEITTAATALVLADVYVEPLFNYVLFRAYSKDAEYAANAALAQGYMQVFMSLLGLKTSKDFAFSPETNKIGATPNLLAARAGGV
ncbi:MAG: DUF6682 family protein [Planctomycetota bacterium]|jgi:hypothetical protein